MINIKIYIKKKQYVKKEKDKPFSFDSDDGEMAEC